MSSPAESNDPVLNTCPACDQPVDVTELEPFAKIECPYCAAAMRVRTAFDHFQLVEQIGQGGMSRVFRATDSLLNRDVALKVLNQECASAIERIEQFEREAQITASFSHPNVVKVFSVGEDQGFFYIAMELVSYSSFEDAISRRRRISEGEVLNIGLAVTQGLLAAHSAGLIHRDIKPGNVLFAEDGTAKIVDFGLALVVERDVDTSNEIWATPYYVAPEKLSGGTEDFRSDMYSLGATLYHALAGVPPVETSTVSIDELRRLKAQPVDVGSMATDITLPTVSVINCMLAHNPSHRFESYEQLTEALQAAKQGKIIPAVAGRANQQGRRKKVWIAGIAAGLAAVGAVIFFQLASKSGTSGAAGTNMVLDETTSGASSSTSKFLEARMLLLEGNFSDSAELFAAVAAAETVQQPTTNWALFNLGLCHLLQFDEDAAVASFRKIVGNGVFSKNREDLELVTFFLDAAKHAQASEPVRLQQMDVFKNAGYECVALLPVGLRRWGLGDVEGATVLLQEFKRLAQSTNSQWVSAYAKLAEPFLEDAKLLKEIPELPEEGIDDETEQLDDFLAVSKNVANELMVTGGPHRSRLSGRIADAEKRLAALHSAGAEERAKLVLRLLRKDRGTLKRELAEMVPLREQLQLEACAKRLQAIQSSSEKGARERDAWAQIFRDADAFVKGLGKTPLASSFRGPVIPRTGRPLFGKSFRIKPQGIAIQVADHSREERISFTECAPPFLVALGESALHSLSDSDGYLELVTRIVSFARIYELESTVGPHLKLLADVVEAESFGRERLQILGGDRSMKDRY